MKKYFFSLTIFIQCLYKKIYKKNSIIIDNYFKSKNCILPHKYIYEKIWLLQIKIYTILKNSEQNQKLHLIQNSELIRKYI